MKILIGLIFVGITVTILCNNASAQEMCVIPEQKVSSIKGIVAFVGAENRIKGAKINLKAKNESDKSITEVETDQDGLFEIKGARKGKYNLVVSYPNAVHAFCWLFSKTVSRNWRTNFCFSRGRSLTCSNLR